MTKSTVPNNSIVNARLDIKTIRNSNCLVLKQVQDKTDRNVLNSYTTVQECDARNDDSSI